MVSGTQPSKYLPIWNALKRDKVCRISADLKDHKTIIKMVRRRRDKDLAFLYELEESNRTHEITVKKNGAVITFFLTLKLKPRGI